MILTMGAISPLEPYGSKEKLPEPANSEGLVMAQDAEAQGRSPTWFR